MTLIFIYFQFLHRRWRNHHSSRGSITIDWKRTLHQFHCRILRKMRLWFSIHKNIGQSKRLCVQKDKRKRRSEIYKKKELADAKLNSNTVCVFLSLGFNHFSLILFVHSSMFSYLWITLSRDLDLANIFFSVRPSRYI